jgi:hypothetical protein
MVDLRFHSGSPKETGLAVELDLAIILRDKQKNPITREDSGI